VIRRSFIAPAVIGLAGILAAVAVAAAGKMNAGSTVGLLAWAIGGAVITTAIAAISLWFLRRRAAMLQVTVASLAPIVAITAGVVGGSWAMFLSSHDLRALVVILIGAGTVAVITALLLGRRVARASADLGEMARRIGDDGASHPEKRNLAGPSELSSIALELDAALVRLEESRAQAAVAEQSRRELVAWVSHDLRTPLAGIRAMVEALSDGVVSDPETIERYHHTICNEVDRLAALVSDLFELSRIHAGALRLELAPVRVSDVLSDVVAGATLLARAKGVTFTTSISDDAVSRVSHAEIVRAVQNLVDNAIRHTAAGGQIRLVVDIDSRANRSVISVTDSCGGIPPDDLSRVFDVSFSGDVARTPGDGRAGLGLAVARGLVEAQEGQVGVQNVEGGCRFSISLPLTVPSRA